VADGSGHPSASELVEVTRRDLAEVEREIRSHRFFAALDGGRVPRERLGELRASSTRSSAPTAAASRRWPRAFRSRRPETCSWP
jgi:hypothetical protein